LGCVRSFRVHKRSTRPAYDFLRFECTPTHVFGAPVRGVVLMVIAREPLVFYRSFFGFCFGVLQTLRTEFSSFSIGCVGTFFFLDFHVLSFPVSDKVSLALELFLCRLCGPFLSVCFSSVWRWWSPLRFLFYLFLRVFICVSFYLLVPAAGACDAVFFLRSNLFVFRAFPFSLPSIPGSFTSRNRLSGLLGFFFPRLAHIDCIAFLFPYVAFDSALLLP